MYKRQHTNLDHVVGGVNFMIAERLGLQNVRVLAPKKDLLMKLVFFVPVENAPEVVEALHKVGVGQIGNYDHCSFSVNGTGTFHPNEAATPFIGNANEIERVNESRVEVIFPAYLEATVMRTLNETHPYEEVAHYLTLLQNTNQEAVSYTHLDVYKRQLIFLIQKINTSNFQGHKTKKAQISLSFFVCVGGPDGTRTRDPMRDRHVF